MILFRPVGPARIGTHRRIGLAAFPPRLPMQPIFYPVLEEEYAVQIARDWNTKDLASGYAGFVTRFEISARLADEFAIQVVGVARHRELWVPAEELEAFNRAIVGEIEVIAAYTSELFQFELDASGLLSSHLSNDRDS